MTLDAFTVTHYKPFGSVLLKSDKQGQCYSEFFYVTVKGQALINKTWCISW